MLQSDLDDFVFFVFVFVFVVGLEDEIHESPCDGRGGLYRLASL